MAGSETGELETEERFSPPIKLDSLKGVSLLATGGYHSVALISGIDKVVES